MFYDPQELAGPSNTKRRLPYAMNNVNQSSREENSKSITDERHSTILEKESVYSEIMKKTDKHFIGSNASDILPIVNEGSDLDLKALITPDYNLPKLISSLINSIKDDHFVSKKVESEDEEIGAVIAKRSVQSSRSRSFNNHEILEKAQVKDHNSSLALPISLINKQDTDEISPTKSTPSRNIDSKRLGEGSNTKPKEFNQSRMKLVIDTEDGRTLEFISQQPISLESLVCNIKS